MRGKGVEDMRDMGGPEGIEWEERTDVLAH